MTSENTTESDSPQVLSLEERREQAKKHFMINACFCVLDAGGIIPWVGWLAEIASFILSANNVVRVKHSTVPDVPRWVTVVTEGMDLATFWIFASHVVPALWQTY